MPANPNRLSQIWQELKRRKVITFFIAYIAASFAIIEFMDITSERFEIPERTFDLLYIVAAIGLPVVIIIPWFINRNKEGEDDLIVKLKSSAEAEEKPMHNLPSHLTTFIGREKEMQTVKELLSQYRVVSLTGAGGCGKTRLACEVASTLIKDYKDGIWFVDLAPVTNENLVSKVITEVLKIPEDPNTDITDTLIEKVKDKSLLIVLDNCEHLLTASAEIARKLVQLVSGLRVLVTSREALKITGEKVWRVPSLTLLNLKTVIDLESANSSEAVLLFSDRAQLNNPNFILNSENVSDVVSICNTLDGIPLAIELVASRIRHMNPQMIIERFSDRFEQLSSSDPGISKRQETLQATIEWSYDLLSDSEKLIFSRLAVFSGGFDMNAAEKVCSDDQLPKESVLELVSKLVDRSLIFTLEGTDKIMRYNRLETLRQFARKKLILSKDEIHIRTKHLHYYLSIAEKAFDEQFESQEKWLDKLEQEHDNIITALNWSCNHSHEVFIRLSGTLAWFWRNHSHLLLGRDYLEKAFSMNNIKSEAYARVLCGLGTMLWVKDVPRGIKLFNESLEIFRKSGNQFEEAIATKEISMAYNLSGDYENGTKSSKYSLELARKVGKPGLINFCLGYVSFSLISLKKYDQALPLVEEYLANSERIEQPIDIITAHHFSGDCALGLRNFKEGEKKYGLAIEISLKFGNTFQASVDMQGVAFSVSGQSRWPKSIRLDAASRQNLKEFGVSMDGKAEFWDEFIKIYLEGAKNEVGKELSRKYEEEGKTMGFEKAVEYALDFNKD